MRVFISINLPESVKKEIKKIQDSLPNFTGKKTEYENLHLTLKFLGEIDEENLPKIRKKLGTIKFKKFEAEIDRIGMFFRYDAGIIWLHLTNCDELQKTADNALGSLFEKEKRFMSHLTIARVKEVKNKKKFTDELSKINMPKKSFIVDGFFLMKSKLDPKGPAYSIIEEFLLI